MARARPILLAAAAAVLTLLVLVPLALRPVLGRVAASRVRAVAKGRGLDVSWRGLRADLPARVAFHRFVAVDAARGDTVFVAESLLVALDPWMLARGRTRIASLALARSTVRLRRGAAEADSLAEDEAPGAAKASDPARARRLRRSVESVVRLIGAPARDLPRLSLSDVTLLSGAGEGSVLAGIRIGWLDLAPRGGGVRLAAVGALLDEQDVPFAGSVDYAANDRVRGGFRLETLDPETGRRWPLVVTVDGALAQDRRAGTVTLHDSSRVTIGRMPVRVGASLARRGPAVRFRLEAAGLDEATVKGSLPPPVLGPLAGVAVDGSWDYRLGFDLDFANPDSVSFDADVVPHGLALDDGRTRLRLDGLAGPFTATIHLPRDRTVTRELSFANPHFRPLEAIAPALVHAVVTNEDGGFFRHRGFNTEAVRQSIAENVRAGAYRRGAGTITMQLARNLWLGHRRTLSRKFQEVVLAWILENLTSVSKERLLEVYLNIIEWGPGVHGADEAARYYFDHDAGEVSVDEALFLSTIVPAPQRWARRFDGAGELRRATRAQMHFIGRAMVAKGWLDPLALPPADSLRVTLAGPARLVLFPGDSLLVSGSPRGNAPGDPGGTLPP